MRDCKVYIFLSIIVAILCSCSTTRVIPDNESRLVANRVDIHNLSDFPNSKISESSISNYIKQKPNTYFILGWNPFLNVYNWSNGKNRGWDKFTKKIGQAPVIYDSTTTKSSLRNINNYLVYRGFYNSIVADSVSTHNKKTTVYYNIFLKDRYLLDNIRYVIKDSAVARLFYKDTSASLLKRGEFLSEQLLDRESERASQYFRNNGYYGFSKNYFFYKADTIGKGGKADLLVTIEDYTRNESPASAKPHRVYYIDSVNIELVRNSASYLNANSRHLDTIHFRDINIIYRRIPFFKRKSIDRINTIVPNSLYSEKSIENTYSRFRSVGLFSAVNIQVNEVDSNRVNTNIKLVASQLQGYKLGFNVSSNLSALFGFSPSVSYYHKNLFKGGEYFNISFMGDFQYWFGKNERATEFGISSSLTIPKFLFLSQRYFKGNNLPKTAFSLSYSYQERPEYIRNIISGTFGYNWNVHKKFFYTLNPLQLSIINIAKLEDSFLESLDNPFLRNSYQNHFDLGLGFTLYYTTDPSGDNKKSYLYVRTQTDLSGNLLSAFNSILERNNNGEHTLWNTPYSQYVREEVSTVYTFRFGRDRKQALASRLLLGIGTGYGNSDVLPFEKLFWSGGANSLRAWQARTVGPGYSARDTLWSLPNQTGELRLEANVEYRFPMFWMFDGALFADAGNVWNLRRSKSSNSSAENFNKGVFKFNNFYKHLALDWGAGLRLNLDFVLIRLDMGLKTYDPEFNIWNGPSRWFKRGNYGVQFGVGYPF